MNILFLSHIWPPAIDGGSQIIYQTHKHLKKLGHQTLTLTTNCFSTDDFIIPKSACRRTSLQSQNIIRLPVYKTKFFIYLSKIIKNNIFSLLKIGPIFKAFPFINALIKVNQFKPDLIITGPFPTTISLYAYILAKITKSKLIIIPCFHHQDPAFQNKLLLNILKNANLIWTLSTYEQQYLSKKLSISQSKFFTLYPGIKLKTLVKPIQKDNQNINLLFLGNFAAHKRIELLISSFVQIHHKYPNTSLTLAGQSTLYFPQIKKHLLKTPANISKNITIFAQKYNQTFLKKLLDKSYILINPSVHESFGLVFMEALSRGVPIIGSDITTVRHLITRSKSGLVFKKDNIKDLTKKISALIDNQSLYKQFSQNGLKFTKDLRWNKIITNLNTKIAQI